MPRSIRDDDHLKAAGEGWDKVGDNFVPKDQATEFANESFPAFGIAGDMAQSLRVRGAKEKRPIPHRRDRPLPIFVE